MQVPAIRLKTFRIANQSTNELCKLIKDKSYHDAIECVCKLKMLQTFRHSDYETKITPLNLAVKSQNLELIQSILEKGISPNEKDGNGNNAFYYAAEVGNACVVSLLERYDNNKDPEWFTVCRIS